MTDERQLSDDEIRRRYAQELGLPLAALDTVPVAQLRAVIAAIDEQVETYTSLGFEVPAPATS